MHWRVDREVLRRLVPEPLEIDEFDGTGWVGVTPFQLVDLRVRGFPMSSSFPELNVRTYVRYEGRPGVYFFSLDAGNWLAVLGARLSYGLPYHRAHMDVQYRNGWIHYQSRRRGADAELVVRYRPDSLVYYARTGRLDHFLTERYALYNVIGGAVVRADIHHARWPLQRAIAHIESNSLLQAHGITTIGSEKPLCHYARRQDTLIWPPLPLLGARHATAHRPSVVNALPAAPGEAVPGHG